MVGVKGGRDARQAADRHDRKPFGFGEWIAEVVAGELAVEGADAFGVVAEGAVDQDSAKAGGEEEDREQGGQAWPVRVARRGHSGALVTRSGSLCDLVGVGW